MANVRRPLVILLVVALALVVFAAGWLTGRLGIGKVADPASLTEAERQFAERMRGVTLVGSFTTDGRKGPPQVDRYDIVSVEKAGEDLWRFNSKCCGLNVAVPFVVPMRFNGDTPMILMTETSLPGMGTFSARVFFYGDRYAGTWQHGEVGGHMWGRIEKTAAPGIP